MSLRQMQNMTLDSRSPSQQNTNGMQAPMVPGAGAPPQTSYQQAIPTQQHNTTNTGVGTNSQSTQNPMDKWAFLSDNGQQQNTAGGEQQHTTQQAGEQAQQQANANSNDPRMPTPQEISKAFENHNFAGNISTAQVEEAMSNPEKFLEFMASFGRQVASMSASVSTQATDPYLQHLTKTSRESAISDSQKQIKLDTVKSLISADPAISDPKFGPTIDMVTQRYMKAYPNASAQDVAAIAKEYLVENFGVQNPETQQSAQSAGWEDIVG